MIKIIRGIVAAGLVAAIAISGYFALKIQDGYAEEDDLHTQEMRFDPVLMDPQASEPEAHINQGVLDLQKQNEDAVGWIAVPYTKIDYPFVQAKDNDYYLHKDLFEHPATAGTIFMDCRNRRDLSDFNTILYGHHMKNGSMFGELAEFEKNDFFDQEKNGTVFLADRTYALDFFACFVTNPDDGIIYGIPTDNEAKLTFLDYLKNHANHYRDIGVTPEDHIVTLSTCSYEFQNARLVLLGKLRCCDG